MKDDLAPLIQLQDVSKVFQHSEAVMELLRTMHDEGSTIGMVTHDPRYAEHAQREIHLFDGRMRA